MTSVQCRLRFLYLFGLVIAVSGCRPSSDDLGDTIISDKFAGQASAESAPASPGVYSSTEQAPRTGVLTMRSAMHRAVRFSPILRAAGEEIRAKKGEAYQAGRRPNPELATEVENFGGSGEFSGSDSAETTVSLTQSIELGRKRLKRLRVAELDTDLANWDYEAARLRVASQTLQAFVDVLASQTRLSIHNEFLSITTRLTDTVAERVKSGKVSPVELSRAEVEQARAAVSISEEKAALDVARRKLALFWGAKSPDFERAVGELAATNHLPPPTRFNAYLKRNPIVARWADEMAQRQATFDLEKARRIPNLNVGAGVRRFEATDDTAIVAGVSIDLPFFNRNRGNIDAASARVAKSIFQRDAAAIELKTRFVEAYGMLSAAEAKLRALEGKVLPKAKAAFDATERGYKEGKFDLLNVLDVQRSLIGIRLDIINTKAEFHKAKAVIEGLIGRDLYKL